MQGSFDLLKTILGLCVPISNTLHYTWIDIEFFDFYTKQYKMIHWSMTLGLWTGIWPTYQFNNDLSKLPFSPKCIKLAFLAECPSFP